MAGAAEDQRRREQLVGQRAGTDGRVAQTQEHQRAAAGSGAPRRGETHATAIGHRRKPRLGESSNASGCPNGDVSNETAVALVSPPGAPMPRHRVHVIRYAHHAPRAISSSSCPGCHVSAPAKNLKSAAGSRPAATAAAAAASPAMCTPGTMGTESGSRWPCMMWTTCRGAAEGCVERVSLRYGCRAAAHVLSPIEVGCSTSMPWVLECSGRGASSSVCACVVQHANLDSKGLMVVVHGHGYSGIGRALRGSTAHRAKVPAAPCSRRSTPGCPGTPAAREPSPAGTASNQAQCGGRDGRRN